jgi:hypothetical protein
MANQRVYKFIKLVFSDGWLMSNADTVFTYVNVSSKPLPALDVWFEGPTGAIHGERLEYSPASPERPVKAVVHIDVLHAQGVAKTVQLPQLDVTINE